MPRFITPLKSGQALRRNERIDPLLVAYFKDSSRALLTREEEVALGRQMDHGQRGIVGAVASSEPGAAALKRLALRLKRSQTLPRAVLLISNHDQCASSLSKVVAELARLSRELCRLAAADGEARGRPPRRELLHQRAIFVERFFDGGLDPEVLSFAVRRLEQLAQALDLPERDLGEIRQRSGLPATSLRRVARDLLVARTELEQARERMIASNLKLVVSIARRFVSNELPLADLIQEGNLGLMYAVDRWDHRRGFKLSTYATWWIHQAIRRAIANQARLVRVPVYMGEIAASVSHSRRSLTQALGRAPTVEELASAARTSPEQIQAIMSADGRSISLETPVGQDGEGVLGDLLADPECPDPTDRLYAQQLASLTTKVLGQLSAREARIIELRFGIGRGPDMEQTLEQVGQQFGVTRERIRQIQNKALVRLRAEGASRLKQLAEE